MKILISIGLLFSIGMDVVRAQGVSAIGLPIANSGSACGTPTMTNLKIWVSADCVNAGACASQPSAGSTVLTWKDRSGNGNDLVATGASGFNICIFRTGQINGLPAMDMGPTGNCGYGTPTFDTGATTWAVFAVFRNAATGTFKGDFTGCNSAGCLKYWLDNNWQNGADRSQLSQIAHGNTASNTSWHQQNMQFQNASAGNSMVFRLDRASDGPASFSSTNISVNIKWVGIDGSPGFFQEALFGYLAEIMIYSGTSPLSGSDITANETYLNCRYGL